jgi:glycosyltransferase involved in cell wall biosynthesis
LASLPDGPFYQSITNKRVKLLPVDFSKKINPSLFFQLKTIIKTNKIQIAHGQGTRAEFYARIANKIAGRSKYVSTIAMPVEGFDIGYARKMLYRFFDWISEKFVDTFIVVSDSLKNKLIRERGIDPDKVVRIYNGIELDKYSLEDFKNSRQNIRREFNIDDNTYIIGAIGRFVWQKGFKYLIQAIPDVIRFYPDVKFLVVGDGPLKAKLEALSMELGVKDKIIFTGFRNDIKRILSAIDILVIPSLKEGFPMITLEGMAMAKPIIGTRIPGIEEQITDNETGILVADQDANSVARAITKLLDNRGLADTLGWNARGKVEKEFSVEKMLGETEKVYQSLT